jgi:murein DD-endopeptidase MepM/ murein hydrolase activator NlpD
MAPPEEPWYVSASAALLESWGLTGRERHGRRVLRNADDADRATRQLEAAAAQVEARRVAALKPPKSKPAPAATPSKPPSMPNEGDPGISDKDQRKVPPLDPKLARRVADQLRADMRRFPASGAPTRPGQGDLPPSGETVYGVPSKAQLLKFEGTRAERKAGITWLSQPVSGGRITQVYTHDHHALDIVARSASLIKAAAAGRVAWAGWRDNGGGFQVWVRHAPGLYTAYYHMSELLVRSGQKVPRGKAVGVIGSTGYSTGTHLHFEMWRNGVPGAADRRVNALRYVKP